MDHGILNVTLSKRGDIDKQIDEYKRDQAAKANVARKNAADQRKLDKEAARVCLEAILARPELIAAKAEALGFSSKDLRYQLRSWATWEPKKLLSLSAKWLA
jgi:hypothetical protein